MYKFNVIIIYNNKRKNKNMTKKASNSIVSSKFRKTFCYQNNEYTSEEIDKILRKQNGK